MKVSEVIEILSHLDSDLEIYLDSEAGCFVQISAIEPAMILPDMVVNEETFSKEVRPINAQLEWNVNAVIMFPTEY